MTFQSVEVDGVSDVRGENLVALILQSLPRRCQFREFRASGGRSLLKRGVLAYPGNVNLLVVDVAAMGAVNHVHCGACETDATGLA